METPRWHLRLEHFGQAVELLNEAVTQYVNRGLSELEKAGLVQRFEIAWELGWKTVGDWLLAVELADVTLTPGSVIRTAAKMRLIDDGDDWLLAGKLRNVLSHEYSQAQRDEGIELIKDRYLPMMIKLQENMRARRDDT